MYNIIYITYIVTFDLEFNLPDSKNDLPLEAHLSIKHFSL